MSICAEKGKVRNDWKKAIIVPIYEEKGDKGNYNNYRALSVLRTIGKMLSK